MPDKLPSIVIVGRPNVGKSTLFNRLTGTRRSIVTDEPGITRDRIYGNASWEGKPFEVVDTGGIVPDDQAGIPGEILKQAKFAIDNATTVVQVVDARDPVTPRSHVPVALSDGKYWWIFYRNAQDQLTGVMAVKVAALGVLIEKDR